MNVTRCIFFEHLLRIQTCTNFDFVIFPNLYLLFCQRCWHLGASSFIIHAHDMNVTRCNFFEHLLRIQTCTVRPVGSILQIFIKRYQCNNISSKSNDCRIACWTQLPLSIAAVDNLLINITSNCVLVLFCALECSVCRARASNLAVSILRTSGHTQVEYMDWMGLGVGRFGRFWMKWLSSRVWSCPEDPLLEHTWKNR